MKNHEVGEKVRIREWSDMEKEFGLNKYGDINSNPFFISSMKKYCGKTLTIDVVLDDGRFSTKEGGLCIFSNDMICFEKSDMKDGNMLKTRDGKIYMWLNGKPRSLNDRCVGLTLEDLTNEYSDEYDIMEVRDSSSCPYGIINIFKVYESLPVIWKRKEDKKVMEFSMEEINEILKEKYPEVDEYKIKMKEVD